MPDNSVPPPCETGTKHRCVHELSLIQMAFYKATVSLQIVESNDKLRKLELLRCASIEHPLFRNFNDAPLCLFLVDS